VFQKLGHASMIVALIAATGGHWAVLQSVAWTNMLAQNLRAATVCQSLQTTFDGDHPCCLCKAIAAGKKTEKKTEFSPRLKKIEFLSQRAKFLFCAPTRFDLLPSAESSSSGIIHPPSVPPPRGCLV
jgi:hypothetical protein